MKKHIPTITIFIIIIGIIALGIWYSDKNSPIKELAKLNVYSKEELSFLEEEGFLNDINSENLPSNKEEVISLLKSSNLIEQNLNSPDESFEVLATKLDEDTYQLAFKLENKSNQSKEFYLIPISESSQAEFKEIKGIVKNGKVSWGDQGDWGYDIEKHKQELRPELAKAYDDIDNNGYTGKPIKLVLEASSTLLAQSKWEIIRGPTSDSLEPVYLLVYGSAGGVKDELGAGDPQAYEFLIKIEDKLTSKRGDCIIFKLAGWDWGSNERKHYAIIKIPDITYEQAKEWCSFEDFEVEVEIKGVTKSYFPKKYKFDLEENFPDKIDDWLEQEKEMEVFEFSEPTKLIKKK